MNTNYTTKGITVVFLLVITSTKLAASEIYHWVDENGVQHFSQYRPAGNIPDVSELQLGDSVVSGNDQVTDVYNIDAHEKHMAAWREERKQKREDARERKRQVAQQQPVKYTQPGPYYSRSYWYPPIYNRPPIKPEPPIVLPSPPSTLLPRGNSG